MNNWTTIGRTTTHLRDLDDESLFGKALCGSRFNHFQPSADVQAGHRVNCARCLVKIGWAKKIGSKKVHNEAKGASKSVGYSETYYELVKDLFNARLGIDLIGVDGDHKAGTLFYTNTENPLWKF